MYHQKLKDTGFLRLPDVLEYIPVSKSTWWEGVKNGRFPQPVKLGSRLTAWKARDIHELIQQIENNPHKFCS